MFFFESSIHFKLQHLNQTLSKSQTNLRFEGAMCFKCYEALLHQRQATRIKRDL